MKSYWQGNYTENHCLIIIHNGKETGWVKYMTNGDEKKKKKRGVRKTRSKKQWIEKREKKWQIKMAESGRLIAKRIKQFRKK